jgi:3-hydroxyacyl-CoA dehydrogenase
VEEYLPEHAVFASNTSAIPIARIAEASKRPQNVIGMHYFSPVPMMPLLEIIPHKGTSDAACATAFEVSGHTRPSTHAHAMIPQQLRDGGLESLGGHLSSS